MNDEQRAVVERFRELWDCGYIDFSFSSTTTYGYFDKVEVEQFADVLLALRAEWASR